MSGSPSSILEWRFTRDRSGRLERVGLPGGKETLFSYESFPDEADQVKTVRQRFSSDEITYEYDRRGTRTGVTDKTGTIHYEWDQFGQITSVRRSIGPAIEYRYDSLRRLKGYRVGSEFDVEYEYDFLSRVESIKTPVGTVRYEYWTGQGKTIRILPNGIRTIWDREPGGQLAAITHVDTKDYIIAKFGYSYRPDGLIEGILEWCPHGERQLSFEYDAVQRLVAVSDSAGKNWRSTYDSLGNRIKEIFGDGYAVDYRHDWVGRLTSVNGTACAHDDCGNLSVVRLDGGLRRFEFDHDNRICRANPGEVHYEHDGDGCLVVRTCRGERTVYISDPFSDHWHPLVELLSGGRQRFYLWEDSNALALVENGAATFFLHDHIGSVRCVADRSGNIIERRDYSPFGVFEGVRADTDLLPGFAGLFWDTAASVYLTQARAYSPDLGRFLQIDPQHRVPFGLQKDLSPYVYCGNDPVNCADKTGLMPEPVDDEGDKRRGPAGSHGAGDGHDGGLTGRPGDAKDPDDHRSLPRSPDPDRPPDAQPDAPSSNTSSDGPGASVGHPGGGDTQGRTRPISRSPWSRFTEFLQDSIPRRAPAEPPKRFDPTLADYIVTTVTQDVNAYAKAKFGSESGLTEDQLREARRGGLQQFFKDHAAYLDYRGPKFGRIENRLASSKAGRFNVDWFTTLGHASSRFFNLPLSWIYVPGKELWFAIRSATTQAKPPDFSSFGALFPLSDWTAAELGDELLSGKISIRDALAPTQRTATNGHVDSGEKAGIRGLAGASFQASSVPLTGQELQDWEKAHGKKRGTPYSKKAHIRKTRLRDRNSRRPFRFLDLPWFQFPSWLWNLLGDEPPELRQGAAIGPDDQTAGGGGAAALSPSPVGGVYLGGAGALLDGLGQVTGIATDPETGRLILLTEQAGSIQLPPLRVDDLVTVFRSVYVFGEGPSVTINPRPNDPHGPWMDVVHGMATPGTYVGWVLFQADRIMKAYNLGEDNISRSPLSSAVAGYDGVLNTVFFGGDFADGKKTGGNWERFWIVPAEVSRFHASSKDLTLFDVPLKVKTQRMVLKNGKLEDDSKGRSSKGALAFVEWFTRTYEGIAHEQYLAPPPETGILTSVPIFSELRRIALMSAVAEQLRDRGVPLPPWMKDYEVKRIPVPDSTPAMTVTKTATTENRTVTASIYGGVNLSPADEAVKQFDRGSDLKRLSPTQREVCSRQVAAADDLAAAIISAARAKSMLVPISVQSGARKVQAVALPGSGSKALSPCRLEEVDLDVPIQGGGRLALERLFNSFFQPNGPWGKGWTADWPHLDEVKMPLERTDKDVRFKLVNELSTPLGRIHARFSEARHVPELNAKLLVPDSECEVLALAAANDPIAKHGKTEVVFKDGRIWFFDQEGNFAGEQSKPFTTVYLRDSAGFVRQMIGYEGDQARAAVRLAYDKQGRLEFAESEDGGEKIIYQYDSDGYLESVTSAEGKTSYTYEHGLVKTISWSARIGGERFEIPTLRQEFDYAPNGQLLAETADGIKTLYTVQMENGRHRLAITPEDGSNETVAVYDERLRALEVTEPDNTRTKWAYEADGGVKTETTRPNGEVAKTSLSADGRHKVTETSDNVLVREDRDEGGRLTNVSLNQIPVLQQEWHPNGLLKSISCETHKVIPQYDQHGRVQSALRVKPEEGDRFSLWQETQFDESGRVKAVKDNAGADIEVGYDTTGDVAGLMMKRDRKDFGFNIKKNSAGQIEQVSSSWGQEERRYDVNGSPGEVVVKKGPATAKAEYNGGRIASLTQFDGSRIQFDYHADGKDDGRLKSVQTPAVTLNYHYGPDGAIAGVDLGEACRTTYEHDAEGNLVRLVLEPRNRDSRYDSETPR